MLGLFVLLVSTASHVVGWRGESVFADRADGLGNRKTANWREGLPAASELP